MNSLYFVEHKGKTIRGQWFLELDRDTNSRAVIVEMIRTGEVVPVKILEINEDDGTCRDATWDEDFVAALVEARLPEIRASVFSQFDHAQDLRKHEVQ